MKDFLASFVNTNGVAFPNTAAVNSSGGGATDGTEFVKIMVDDMWGFDQALLNYTDDTPNGNSEVGASQKLTSLQKMRAYITTMTSTTTHTVEDWNKKSILILDTGCATARIVGGTGCNRSNKIVVYNKISGTVNIDFGASSAQDVIVMQKDQWIEFFYDDTLAKFIFQRSNREIIINVDADYTIGDWVPSGTKILVSPNSSTQKGLVVVTLPTMADNIGKWYEVEHKTGQGLIAVVTETPGSEKLNFKGSLITSSYIYSRGMSYKYKNNGTDWTLAGRNLMSIGWHGRSDRTAVKIGNGVTYDNGSGTSTKNTDWTGMLITEATSGFTGVVVKDTGGNGVTGILYIYELSSNFTFWTNNRVLTASNGQTIDINETTGTSKNVDYYIYYGFNLPASLFDFKYFVNATATFINANRCFPVSTNAGTYDLGFGNVTDLNTAFVTVGGAGFHIIQSDISVDSVAGLDGFDNIILDFSC